jgi:hypothetical protein
MWIVVGIALIGLAVVGWFLREEFRQQRFREIVLDALQDGEFPARRLQAYVNVQLPISAPTFYCWMARLEDERLVSFREERHDDGYTKQFYQLVKQRAVF